MPLTSLLVSAHPAATASQDTDQRTGQWHFMSGGPTRRPRRVGSPHTTRRRRRVVAPFHGDPFFGAPGASGFFCTISRRLTLRGTRLVEPSESTRRGHKKSPAEMDGLLKVNLLTDQSMVCTVQLRNLLITLMLWPLVPGCPGSGIEKNVSCTLLVKKDAWPSVNAQLPPVSPWLSILA